MKNSILVSCIIPIYNVESDIIECLESVHQQSYKKIEIILIDDCGSDKSMELAEKFITKSSDSRFRIIHHHKNLGLSAARNTGIRNAKGEYIFFIDSDDYISVNCIESFISIIKKHQNPDIVFGSAIQIPQNWREVCISVNKKNIPEFSDDQYWIKKSFIKDEYLPVTAWNKLIRKDFLIKNNLYFKEGIIYEDFLWNWLIGNTVRTIAFNKNITYYYRYNSNSIINTQYSYKNKRSEEIIIKSLFFNIDIRFFFNQFLYILHYSHSSYCRIKYYDKPLPPAITRYPKAFIFLIRCLLKPIKKNEL